jgi:polysaccharide export outer membrane protein
MTNLLPSFVLVGVLSASGAIGREQTPTPAPPPTPATAAPAVATADLPDDYVIGADDVLGVVFWREADLSGDVTVRPDGRITLPVLGEMVAAGMKPADLQARIQTMATKYINDPNVAVVVRTIHSRKVFVTGRVTNPGTYDLKTAMTVLQGIAVAGGLTEYADAKNITVLRKEEGRTQVLKFNYRDVSKGKNLEQNVNLHPGDTIVVP